MMTDVLVKSGATDAAASSKNAAFAKKGGSDDSKLGFSSALSGFDKDAKPPATPGDASNGEGHQLEDDQPASEGNSVAAKPIIDLKPGSVRQLPSEIRTQAHKAATSPVAEEGEQPQGATASSKLQEALAAAKSLIRKAENADGGGDKTAAADAAKPADAETPAEQAESGPLLDVLSLLVGPTQQRAAEAGGANQKNSNVVSGKRGSAVDTTAGVDAREATMSSTATGTRGLSASASEQMTMPTSADTAPEQQRLFRFTGARDNHSMDMAIGGTSGEKSAEFKTSGNGTAENVTVLDSRRFLGLASNSNGSALTAAIAGDSEWSAAMQPGSALSNAAAQSSTGSVVNTLKLQMTPHDLGSVTATLRLRGEELNVHLTVETRAAYRQLSDDSNGIVDALRAQGFAVDQVTISIAPTADSDTTKNQQSGNQPGQQAMNNGERQGSASGRGQEQTSGRQQAEDGTRNSHEAVSDTAAAAAPGSARPEQLYL